MKSQKKILLTFDLNCLVGYIAPIKNFVKENSLFPDYPPHKTENGLNIWNRPNLDILLKHIFVERKQHYDVGVWASQTKENTAFMVNQFFGSLKYNLKFVLFTKPPEDSKTLLPFPAKRDLRIIFDKYPQYDENNTIIFSNFKNENSDYRTNEVILPLYHPEIGTTQFNLDAHMYYVYEYITVLNTQMIINKIEDVRETMKMIEYEKLIRLRTANTKPDKTKWDVSNLVRF
jgi:hypothetical protein